MLFNSFPFLFGFLPITCLVLGLHGGLSLDYLRAFVLSASANRVVDGVLSQVHRDKLRRAYGRRVRDQREIIARANQSWREGSDQRSSEPFSVGSVDEHGDIQFNVGSFFHDDPQVASVPPLPSARGPWRRLERLARWCRGEGIQLFITWPSLPATRERYGVTAQRNLEQIQRRAEELGLPSLGNPTDYALDERYFFN